MTRQLYLESGMKRLVMLFLGASILGCASLRHASSPTQPIPDDSSDGVIVSMQLAPAPARDAVTRALRATGFTVAAASTQSIRTNGKRISTDTVLVVTATIVPVELPNARTYITLSATYSVGRSASVTVVGRREDTPRGPWRYLTAVADSLRRISGTSVRAP